MATLAELLAHQRQLTAQQLEQRCGMSDQLGTPRPVDHSGIFPDKESASEASRELESLGYGARISEDQGYLLLEVQKADSVATMTGGVRPLSVSSRTPVLPVARGLSVSCVSAAKRLSVAAGRRLNLPSPAEIRTRSWFAFAFNSSATCPIVRNTGLSLSGTPAPAALHLSQLATVA